jgi:RNA polymerase sigma factor (sigma-70 family)
VEQIRRGDIAGQEALYAALSGGARLFLRRRTGREDVDDLVHDVFLTVTEAIQNGQLRQPERLMGFVRTILQRTASSHRQPRRPTLPLDSQPDACLREPQPDPEESSIQQQKNEIMHQVLGELRPRERDILRRFYVDEEPETNIRREMKLTPTQFRLMKSRAKIRFTELVKRRLKRPPVNQQ